MRFVLGWGCFGLLRRRFGFLFCSLGLGIKLGLIVLLLVEIEGVNRFLGFFLEPIGRRLCLFLYFGIGEVLLGLFGGI